MCLRVKIIFWTSWYVLFRSQHFTQKQWIFCVSLLDVQIVFSKHFTLCHKYIDIYHVMWYTFILVIIYLICDFQYWRLPTHENSIFGVYMCVCICVWNPMLYNLCGSSTFVSWMQVAFIRTLSICTFIFSTHTFVEIYKIYLRCAKKNQEIYFLGVNILCLMYEIILSLTDFASTMEINRYFFVQYLYLFLTLSLHLYIFVYHN